MLFFCSFLAFSNRDIGVMNSGAVIHISRYTNLPPPRTLTKKKKIDVVDVVLAMEKDIQKYLKKQKNESTSSNEYSSRSIKAEFLPRSYAPGFAQRLHCTHLVERQKIAEERRHHTEFFPRSWKPTGVVVSTLEMIRNEGEYRVSDEQHWKQTLRSRQESTTSSPNARRRLGYYELRNQRHVADCGLMVEQDWVDVPVPHREKEDELEQTKKQEEEEEEEERRRKKKEKEEERERKRGEEQKKEMQEAREQHTGATHELGLLEHESELEKHHRKRKEKQVSVVKIIQSWSTEMDSKLAELVRIHGKKWGTIRNELALCTAAWDQRDNKNTKHVIKNSGSTHQEKETYYRIQSRKHMITGPQCRKRFIHLQEIKHQHLLDRENQASTNKTSSSELVEYHNGTRIRTSNMSDAEQNALLSESSDGALPTSQNHSKKSVRETVSSMTMAERRAFLEARRSRLRCRIDMVQHVEQVEWLVEETNRLEDFDLKLETLEKTDHNLNHRESLIMTQLIRITRQIGLPIETVEEMKELVHMIVIDIHALPIHPFDAFTDIILSLWRGWHHVTAKEREQKAKKHLKMVLKNKMRRNVLMKMEDNGIELDTKVSFVEEDIEDKKEFHFFTKKMSEDCVHRVHEWVDSAHSLFWAFTHHQDTFTKRQVRECHQVAVNHELKLLKGRRRVEKNFNVFWHTVFENQKDGCTKHNHGIDFHLFLEHLHVFEVMHQAFSHEAVFQ